MSTARVTTLLDLGRHAEALDALESMDPDERLSATAHCLRARAYLGLKRWKDAEQAAAAARAASPDGEWGYRLGAIVARKQRRPKVAVKLATEAVRLAPHEPNTHQVATLTAIDAGDRDAALLHAGEMLRLAPHNAMSHYTHGLALLMHRRNADAEAAFRQALAVDPQHAMSMSALAEVVGDRDRAQAAQLRLAAVRTAPHEAHHRRSLLRRGGVVGGGLVAAGKVGLLGKLVIVGALNSLVHGLVRDDAIVAGLLVTAYVLAFVVTRIRRHLHGRSLPPLVWEGLRAERRNADLLWLAVPAGAVACGALIASVVGLATGRLSTALVYLAASVAVLALCWSLRRGDARQRRLRDVLGDISGIGRFVWQRGQARRLSRRRSSKPTIERPARP